jgi:hypothetical protein
MKQTHMRILPDSEEVVAVGAYFSEKIRELKTNWFLVYTGSKTSYQRKNKQMVAVQNADDVTELWISDMIPSVDKMNEKCEDKLVSFFMNDFLDIWPEAMRVISPPRPDDIILSDDDQSEEEEVVLHPNADELPDRVDDEKVAPEDSGDEAAEDEFVPLPDIVLSDYKESSSDDDYEMEDDELKAEPDENYEIDSPPRVSELMSDQFMRSVANSPRKRRRRQAAAHYSYPYLP